MFSGKAFYHAPTTVVLAGCLCAKMLPVQSLEEQENTIQS